MYLILMWLKTLGYLLTCAYLLMLHRIQRTNDDLFESLYPGQSSIADENIHRMLNPIYVAGEEKLRVCP